MREQITEALDRVYSTWCDVKHRWSMFVFWRLTGWPFKRRCPLCAGDGSYVSETAARYGDPADVCDQCRGTGRVPR
jgi:hypothetical protein